ncbi:hypothetical protein ACRALDRAFT_211423 [Sodiomyces alcalophilus JCM 7366]
MVVCIWTWFLFSFKVQKSTRGKTMESSILILSKERYNKRTTFSRENSLLNSSQFTITMTSLYNMLLPCRRPGEPSSLVCLSLGLSPPRPFEQDETMSDPISLWFIIIAPVNLNFQVSKGYWDRDGHDQADSTMGRHTQPTESRREIIVYCLCSMLPSMLAQSKFPPILREPTVPFHATDSRVVDASACMGAHIIRNFDYRSASRRTHFTPCRPITCCTVVFSHDLDQLPKTSQNGRSRQENDRQASDSTFIWQFLLLR